MQQLVRTTDPLNSEPALDQLAREIVTPADLFYIRNHGTVPDIDPQRFTLSVGGAVQKPLELSLSDIKKRFEKVSVMATLQCAGNRRYEMAAVKPIPGEVEWGAQAIGNAIWSGARLRDVLRVAGIQREARHAAFLGADVIEKHGDRIGFGASVSLEKATGPETLLAYEMNGMPLEPLHGFPLRGVVPGFIGARSVKWLTQITLQAEPSDNFYQALSYKTFPPDVTAESADWRAGTTLEKVAVNAVISRPRGGERLASGPVTICGYAIGDGGSAVARVDISTDGGRTWAQADLLGKSEPWRWNLWEARVELHAGSHEIVARTCDADGNAQPQDGAAIWNFKGYGWNAWHRIRVDVA